MSHDRRVHCNFDAAVPDATRTAILAAIGKLTILEGVVRAGLEILDVVVQDEYTHDVVVRFDPDWVLVFDST
jgi:hypothetical protein